MSYTCQTAPGVEFTTREELHAHYKSEWHRYNLKRKVSSLPPVSREEFEKRKAAALALSAEQRKKAGAGTGTSHLKQDKAVNQAKMDKAKKLKALKLAQAQGLVPPTVQLSTKSERADREVLPTPPSSENPAEDKEDVVLSSDMDESSSTIDAKSQPGQWKEIRWTDDGEEIHKFVVNVKTCIFCKEKSETLVGNIRHMQQRHGMFIPDVEYLVDPEGLIAYLSHKATNGQTCLSCNRQFRTSQSCIQHMVDSGHCMIRYQDDDDFAELADFYDFTSSYPEHETSFVEGDEGKDLGRVDEDDGWETVSEDDGDLEDMPDIDDADEDENEAVTEQSGKGLVKRTITVNEQGELLLLDGRIAGNRKWRRFYKQRYRDLDDSAAMVTINGVSQPTPSKMRAVVRRYPKAMQSQMLLGYSEAGVDALSLVQKTRTPSGVVTLPRQEQRRIARNQQQKMMKLGVKGNKILAKHFKYRDPYV